MSMGSILGSLGQAANSKTIISSSQLDAMNQAIQSSYAQQPQYGASYNFAFEEIENGWIINFRGKKWMVNDLEELSQRVVAVMVENKLEK